VGTRRAGGAAIAALVVVVAGRSPAAASGAEVQDFVDHDISPSADGRRLFGQAGAVFCR
jgi:hypothetical protein